MSQACFLFSVYQKLITVTTFIEDNPDDVNVRCFAPLSRRCCCWYTLRWSIFRPAAGRQPAPGVPLRRLEVVALLLPRMKIEVTLFTGSGARNTAALGFKPNHPI